MKSSLRQYALALGFDDCRCTTAVPPARAAALHQWLAEERHGEMTWLARNADKRADPQKVLPGAKSIILLAASYHLDLQQGKPGAREIGIIARYARFADYHEVLAAPLKKLTDFVNRLGGTDTRSLWYVDTGPVLERYLAQRAGLGFIGKHTNLISRPLGNWFFIAEILTTLELEPDAPGRNHCGTCSRCITACPTQAITAPYQLDARKCISYLTIELKGAIPIELRRAMGNRIYGCDDCLAACPWNRFAREGRLMKAQARNDLTQPGLRELLRLDSAAFKSRFAATPILRTKRRGLLRNVCVALGNVGDETALPDLQIAASDAEPLIAEHARWAITEITARSAAASAKKHAQPPGG